MVAAGRASSERAAATFALKTALADAPASCTWVDVPPEALSDEEAATLLDAALAARLSRAPLDALFVLRLDADHADAPVAWLNLLRADGGVVARFSAARGGPTREWLRLDDGRLLAATGRTDARDEELVHFATPLAPGKLPDLRAYAGDRPSARLEPSAFLRRVGREDLAGRFERQRDLRSRLLVAGTVLMGMAITASLPTLYVSQGGPFSDGAVAAFTIEAAAFVTGLGCLLTAVTLDPHVTAPAALELAERHNGRLRARGQRPEQP